ncbi:hypothetical protein [Lentiprolixibacter aurantiacus]|uniref:Uncharacterized protein n=1 Tax=Lentiprolixibacter aurantiacus TaxID=2993939 RepID=A0AAE3SNM8_9FLAO|nr:hypothetical protein [Lentiprolixibacter aurantiacus]MCX2719715.1 hypothetical protein [Lentiprolixibacter aurantiacus]
MKHRLLIALYYLSVLLVPVYGAGLFPISTTEDPIALCKQILDQKPEPWQPDSRQNLLEQYGDAYGLAENEDKYILLESPTLAFSYFQGGSSVIGQSISRDVLIHMLKQAITAPQETTNILARATIQQGMKEYLKAYEIAAKYRESQELNYADALQFLDNRFGYSKLNHAERLSGRQVSNSQAFNADKNTKKILSELEKIGKRYPSSIPLVNALPIFEDIYQQLLAANVGIASYQPFREFSSEMQRLNQTRINERIKFRSEIRITYPDSGTVWTIPEPVELKWTTEKIDPDKTIRFFLVKDDMVVQDLGIFKNESVRSDIVLRRGLPAGDNYKVMGIEQFPANKYHVAKFATPFFSIRKAPRPQKKPEPEPEPEIVVEEAAKPEPAPVVPEIPEPVKPEEVAVEKPIVTEPPVAEKSAGEEQVPVEIIKEETPVAEKQSEVPVKIPEKRPETEEEIALRNFFDGRSISYTKELVVETDRIQISLWDHGRQDGDIVSIYLNGDQVVSKHTLTYKKKVYEVTLDKSKPNDLFLYAHNLGRFAPNTVSIEINDGSNAENIILNSDLKSCEAVLINVKQ